MLGNQNTVSGKQVDWLKSLPYLYNRTEETLVMACTLSDLMVSCLGGFVCLFCFERVTPGDVQSLP